MAALNRHHDASPESASPTLPEAPIAETEGATIGRYKLLQAIGEGGFGVVYMAEQTEPVTRRVALKIIKLGMDTRQVIARFEAERQALALMDHPNIAKVLDAGATETGRPYFVMELVKGVPITKYCDDHKLSTEDRLRLFLEVCHAIQHAHQKGIIHRDIKPSNILVTLHDGKPVPKVIDFGIAKATQTKLTDKTLFTRYEQIIGTPAYMSPEQAEMSGLDIDTRSDIYSLGVLLYELLAGTTPFDTQQLLSAGLDEMRRIIREQEPIRPSTRVSTLVAADVRRLNSPSHGSGQSGSDLIKLLRRDLDWIVLKCLEKDRARRYETANGLAMDIRRYLASEPVVARPPSAAYRIRKLVHKHKLAFAALSFVLAALLISTGISLRMFLREQAARRAALDSQHSERLQKEEANRARSLAESERENARALSYASDMNLAWRALQDDDLAAVRFLLNAQIPRAGAKDLRNWEWRYLWSASAGDQLFSLPHPEPGVESLAICPNNRLLTGTFQAGSQLRLWDLQSRKVLRSSTKISNFSSLAISPNGEVAAAANWSRDFYLLDLKTLETLDRFQHSTLVWEVVFSPDGKFLATCGSEEMSLWDLASKKHLWSVKTPLGGRSAPAFSSNGRWLVANTREWKFHLYSVPEGRLKRVIEHSQWPQLSSAPLRLSPDDRFLAVGEWSHRITLIDLEKETRRFFTNHTTAVTCVAFSPDGSRLASGSIGGQVRVWDLSSDRETALFRGHSGELTSVEYAPDGNSIYTSARDGTARVWPALLKQTFPGFLAPADFYSRALSGNGIFLLITKAYEGRLLANGSQADSSDCQLVDLRTQQRVAALQLIANFASSKSIAVRNDGGQVAAGGADGVLRLWNTTTQLPREWRAHSNEIDVVNYSLDGRFIASAARGGEVRAWDLNTGRSILDRRSDDRGLLLYDACFTPNGKNLLVCRGNRIHLFSLESPALDRHWDALETSFALAVSSDGAQLASAGRNLAIWSLPDGRPIAQLKGSYAAFNSIAFSPDSSRIVGADGEGVNWFWDVAANREIGRLRLYQDYGRLRWQDNGDTIVITRGEFCYLLRAPAWDEINAPAQ